jgi:TolA-binding protein
MSRQKENTDNNQIRLGFEKDLISGCSDPVLFEAINAYRLGVIDMEDVKNDPALTDAHYMAQTVISDYNKKSFENKENAEFIRNILPVPQEALSSEIKTIKQEIKNYKLNELTAEWVKEWHEKKQKTGLKEQKTDDISDFIKSSIASQGKDQVIQISDARKTVPSKRLILKYSSLAAAALIGAFILIRTLLPTSDPENLFNSYYKPFDAVSLVTRSINANGEDNYSSAIENYKTGNYQEAAIKFAGDLQQDHQDGTAQFYLGLSQLALNNYDQSINLFSEVAKGSGEFGKEARWYLGLTYLKLANKKKAVECFEILSRTDGYYHDRSETILRRLK